MNPTSAKPDTMTCTGRVVDSVTGQPIAGAIVHAAAQTITARTAEDGGFVLRDVPHDALALVAASQGYAFCWQPLPSGGHEITLRLDPQGLADPLHPGHPQPIGAVGHPDYPRPDADHRAANDGKWLPLNGTWSFDFDPADVGVEQGWADGGHVWSHAIAVPFSHTSLAGVGEQDRASNSVYQSQFASRSGTVWYQRELRIPADWPAHRDTLLRFGAVDWHTSVYLDGTLVGEHDDGYLPFDISLGQLAPGSTHSLVVRAVVADNSEQTPYPQGKQTGWYTNTGGIWQSVWLEPAAASRLETVHVTPRLAFEGDRASTTEIDVDLRVSGEPTDVVRLEVREPAGPPGFAARPGESGLALPTPRAPQLGRVVATATVRLVDGVGNARLPIPDGRLWTPETPWLYQLRAEIGPRSAPLDTVETWFGLRSVTRDWAPGHSPAEQDDPREQYQYLYLNNRPIYLRSVLDQAFNPWGGYSYTGLHQGCDLRAGQLDDPRKGSVLFDLALAKQLGFNSLRTHIKVNDPLYYHWADVAGLLVFYDQPNFGYHGFSAQAKELWAKNLRGAVQRDYNHPSIVVWDAFNEAWGFGPQGAPIREDAIPWVQEMTGLVKELTGDTRLVVDNSPCCENGHVSDLTDLNDFHGYHSTFEEWQRVVRAEADRTYPGSSRNFQQGKQSGQPLVNSEFGPWSGGPEMDQEVATPFRFTTELFRSEPKLAGYLFTELADVEFEWNGWSAYDRTLQIPGYLTATGAHGGVREANADDVLVGHGRPVQRVAPGSEVSLGVTAALFSGRVLDGVLLCWRVSGTDDTGTPLPEQPWQERAVTPERFTAAQLGEVTAPIPARLVAGRLDLQLRMGSEVVAAGQRFLAAWDQQPSAVDAAPGADDDRTVVAVDPAAAEQDWPQGARVFERDGASAAAGAGDGAFRWRVEAPAGLAEGSWRHAQLVLEAAAARPDLPRTNHPQTSERRFPTTLRATVNGVATDAVILPDDPADARGFLSYESGYAPGKHGFRVLLDLDASRLRAALRSDELTVIVQAEGGGLTLYGPRTGRFGIAPQLVFSAGDRLPGSGVQDGEPYVGTTEGAGVNTYLVPGQPVLGQRATMTVTVVNDSPEPIFDVRAGLLTPADWRAEPIDEVDPAPLAAGSARHMRFAVTPTSPEPALLRTRVHHTDATGPRVGEQSWQLAGPAAGPAR